MPSPISVYIEMPAYLVKYLAAESVNKHEPFVFPRRHDYNLLLTRLISNDSSIKMPRNTKECVKIQLPFNEFKDVYFYNKLSRDSRILFREAVYRDLYYDLRLVIKELMLAGVTRNKAIEMFFLAYDITENDVNYESFYRSFSRFQQKRRAIYTKSTLTQLSRKCVQNLKRA